VSHVLYFTAEWCNPCQRTKPIAEELHGEGIINFEFVDADSNIDMIKKFEIRAVPTYILIEDGQEVKRMNGAKTRQDFLEFVSKEEIQNG
jgi:thiol-disulfide isomerase/thioredoxin